MAQPPANQLSGALPSAAALATPRPTPARAWFAHFVTACGAVAGLLALIEISRAEWRAAFFWMALALAIDSADGSLARWAQVKRALPEFDGTLLDNIVDYLNYAIVPAFLLFQAELLPRGWSVAGAAAIALVSAYQFCRADAKTKDNYFRGFPSYWNVVVFYLLLLDVDAWIGLFVVTLLCVLVFVPFRFIYPSRTRPFRALTVTLTSIWGLLCLGALFSPRHAPLLLSISLLYVPYYVLASMLARRREAVCVER
jgi:phosphatidylcholine synthase